MKNEKIEKVRSELLHKKNIDFLFVKDEFSLKYLTDLDLKGSFLLSKNRAVYFFENKLDPKIVSPDGYETSFLEEKAFADALLKENKNNLKIAIDICNLSVCQYQKIKKHFQKLETEKNIEITILELENPLLDIREIKLDSEIDNLKEAAKITYLGFEYIQKFLKENITEIDLSIELEYFLKKQGSSGFSFLPVIAFGKNSASPHHIPSNCRLKNGDIILLDFGATYNNYCADMTRCIFFRKVDPFFEEIYSCVKKAHDKALLLCKDGAFLEDVKKASNDVLNSFIKTNKGKNLHGLGHGLGLEVHEKPAFKNEKNKKLRKGMIITIEPGIYVENFGGIRYEDTILIKKDGYENFYPENGIVKC
jgi:Xaa-Pro aminopeptidase